METHDTIVNLSLLLITVYVAEETYILMHVWTKVKLI